jgi:site-specific recombinase XerD
VPYPGIPLLIDPKKNHVVEVASDWLRYLLVKRSEASSSVRQFAYHLKYWWQFLNRSRIRWDQVDDSTMMTWRDRDLRGLEPATVNGYLSTVFRMYLWAEKNAYVRGLIGEPNLAINIHPPLSVEVTSDRRGTCRFVSPLLKKTVAKPVLPTPTHEDITTIHETLAELYGVNVDLMVRDALVLTWAETAGARRMEVLSLKVDQIPSWEEIQRLEDTEEKCELTIMGKGRKSRSIWVGADILIQTREYIENERESVVNRWRKRLGSNYEKPKEIFLSSKTGISIQKDTVSQIFATAFRKAAVRGSMHRVRARFITGLTENAAEKEFEKFGSIPDATSLLLPIAQIAGHSNVETLLPYLAVGKKRLLRQTVAEATALLQERAVGAERRASINLVKLKSSDGALDLVAAVSSGNKRKIANAIIAFCEANSIDALQLSLAECHSTGEERDCNES